MATGAVLLGTLYPLFLDALGLGKISVGPPYFDTVFGLLMLVLVVLMGIGPAVRWKSDTAAELLRRLRSPIGFALVATVASAVYAGKPSWWSIAGMAAGWWIVASVLSEVRHRLWPHGARLAQLPSRLAQMPRAFNGMLLAHLGIAVLVFGVTLVKTHEVEQDVQLGPGQSAEVGGYRFTLNSLRDVEGPNYAATEGELTVTGAGGAVLATLRPQKRNYRVQKNPMTESAIDTNPLRDLYLSLGEPTQGGKAWLVQVRIKPFVTWIWGGCVLMALGGALAASDRRYRVRRREAAADAAAQQAA